MTPELNKATQTGAPLSHVGEERACLPAKAGVRVFLTHPGTQHAPKLARVLYEKGLLYRYATGIAFPDTREAWWWRAVKWLGFEKLLLKRVVPGLPKGKLHLQPAKETVALLRSQVLGQANDDVFYPRNKAFQLQLPQKLIDASDMVIGFDTTSWILAERCRNAGKPFVLDVSIAHPLAKEKVFANLREKYPAWSRELAPKQPKLIEAELQEIAAATHIVVASAFTKKTYTDHGVPPDKISIIPYGTDLKIPKGQIPTEQNLPGVIEAPNSKGGETTDLETEISTAPSPTTFLFFGSLSARKGFPWLCEVWKAFHLKYPECRLIAAGYDNRPAGFTVPEGVEVTGPVHPKDREALFARADVFVFPSFFEGFAQVILEAMVCGLPVITTTATAGPDLFGPCRAGLIIEPGNDTELLASLEYFALHKQEIATMGMAASLAAAKFTWDAYGDGWAGVLEALGE